ncbi:hypothetical protein C8R47DRAFT_972033 [Mycena vitilis]|nr:hypothetical protein C8R47DRAFT_972033 [Mycena vitilis]
MLYQHLQTVQHADDASGNSTDQDTPRTPGPSSGVPLFARVAVDNLSRTSAAFLATSSPLKSTSAPPAFKPNTISPFKSGSRYAHLLDRPAITAREQELVDALRESENRDNARKRAYVDMQSTVILAGMYANSAQTQLQAQEARKSHKKDRRKMGDGRAKYFTGDKFFKLAQDDARDKEAEEVDKEQRKKARGTHTAELAAWKRDNAHIRERNEAKKTQFTLDTLTWEAEKKAAKAEKRKRDWEKPMWKDYKPELLLQRPSLKKKGNDESDTEGEDGDGSGDGTDMDED